MFSLVLFFLVLRFIFLAVKFHPSPFRFRTKSSLSDLFFISVSFISEDIQGYFFSFCSRLKKKIKALRYKNSFFLSFYLFLCSFRSRKRKTSLFKGGLIFHCSVHTIVPIKMSPPLTRGMLKAGNTTIKIVVPSADELLAIKYADYIKTFFQFMPHSVNYYSKDDFIPMVNMLNWICTNSYQTLRVFKDQFKKYDATFLREAYIKGASLNYQEKAVFYDSAHFSSTQDSPRIGDITSGVQNLLDIKMTKNVSITHFFGYGARLLDTKGKVLHPDAITENGTVVDCCKADEKEIVKKHIEKEQKYTKDSSLDYETVHVSYSNTPINPKNISNLFQDIYPSLVPPDIPNYPFPVASVSIPVQAVYPQIHPIKTKAYQDYKHEMQNKFKSFSDFDFSNLQ